MVLDYVRPHNTSLRNLHRVGVSVSLLPGRDRGRDSISPGGHPPYGWKHSDRRIFIGFRGTQWWFCRGWRSHSILEAPIHAHCKDERHLVEGLPIRAEPGNSSNEIQLRWFIPRSDHGGRSPHTLLSQYSRWHAFSRIITSRRRPPERGTRLLRELYLVFSPQQLHVSFLVGYLPLQPDE